MAEAPGSPRTGDESSESENEPEPAKIFHRKLSTKRDVKSAVSVEVCLWLCACVCVGVGV